MASMVIQAWHFIVVGLAGWLNRQRQDIVMYTELSPGATDKKAKL